MQPTAIKIPLLVALEASLHASVAPKAMSPKFELLNRGQQGWSDTKGG